jgi:DNA gyrase subunit A
VETGEKISAVVAVKDFSEDKFLVMATKQGSIKKVKLDQFSNPRKAGIIAISLEKDDALIQAQLTTGSDEISLITRQGKAIRFKENQIREMGRQAKGVRGVRLAKKDHVVAMEVAKPEATLLTVTEAGFGKRTKLAEYRIQSRGGKGIVNIKVTAKNGEVAGAKTVSDKDEVMIMTQNGMVVRCYIKDIRTTGRNAQGVRLISLKEKDKVSSIAPVVAEEG